VLRLDLARLFLSSATQRTRMRRARKQERTAKGVDHAAPLLLPGAMSNLLLTRTMQLQLARLDDVLPREVTRDRRNPTAGRVAGVRRRRSPKRRKALRSSQAQQERGAHDPTLESPTQSLNLNLCRHLTLARAGPQPRPKCHLVYSLLSCLFSPNKHCSRAMTV